MYVRAAGARGGRELRQLRGGRWPAPRGRQHDAAGRRAENLPEPQQQRAISIAYHRAAAA